MHKKHHSLPYRVACAALTLAVLVNLKVIQWMIKTKTTK